MRVTTSQTTGLALGITAFTAWGVLPLYFHTVNPTGTVEIVAWRILLSLPFRFAALLVVFTVDLVRVVRPRSQRTGDGAPQMPRKLSLQATDRIRTRHVQVDQAGAK